LVTTRAISQPFDYKLPEEFSDVDVGTLLVVPFGRRQVTGVVVELTDHTEVDPQKLLSPVRRLPFVLPERLVELALWLGRHYCSTAPRALTLVAPPKVSVRKLLGVRPTTLGSVPTKTVGSLLANPPTLNQEQERALASIVEGLERESGAAVLLHGVTGSGKTEVYLQAGAQALNRGQGMIVLVPEIALTPQTVGRFVARFGDQVAVLHSQLSDSDRYDEWLRVYRGEARVCVGPRSAVFAPVANLGLIVIDEEHDASYKQESDPRYDARVVAQKRAELEGAVFVAGSATPRAESFHNLRRLVLSKRASGQPLPPVSVLDICDSPHALHERTRTALTEVRSAQRKAIVLLNRRGWSNFLSCRSCGRVWSCPNCDVALVLHHRAAIVSCHHCGHREATPEVCPDCKSISVARHGCGTERLERELTQALGGRDFPIFRLDSDSSRRAHATSRLLAAFDQAPAGVLVGTQMVAKGHDFPAVTLAIVLDADQTLRFPDFRAEERTFALIAQLAGRAGRGPDGGRVLVQTHSPSARSILFAADHDSESFITSELERRKALNYPPFSRLIRIVLTAEEQEHVGEAAQEMHTQIAAEECATVLGPAPLFRLRGRERSQLVLKTAPDDQAAIDAVGQAVERIATSPLGRRVQISVDVDPQ
jgi:primosomal protein N' (replication factor Y)